jgi:catechol 2,3-dioxygenase-like lactoylglutathione lyase family enzyme
MTPSALTACAPVLLVRDVVASAHHYRDRLGFSFDRLWGHPPHFVILERGPCRLMLQQAPSGFVITPHWKVVSGLWNAYFWVADADALFAEFQARGATLDYGIGDKPYGVREFGIRDPDGYDLGFGTPLV